MSVAITVVVLLDILTRTVSMRLLSVMVALRLNVLDWFPIMIDELRLVTAGAVESVTMNDDVIVLLVFPDVSCAIAL